MKLNSFGLVPKVENRVDPGSRLRRLVSSRCNLLRMLVSLHGELPSQINNVSFKWVYIRRIFPWRLCLQAHLLWHVVCLTWGYKKRVVLYVSSKLCWQPFPLSHNPSRIHVSDSSVTIRGSFTLSIMDTVKIRLFGNFCCSYLLYYILDMLLLLLRTSKVRIM